VRHDAEWEAVSSPVRTTTEGEVLAVAAMETELGRGDLEPVESSRNAWGLDGAEQNA